MKSAAIREAFLNYFEEHGHTRVPSSSLIPANDPTLLFTNAGMVQFKDVFLGSDHRQYTRAASSQRCVRAGGKHNDLENVGYTARHHTFFEMLGNFSFGDYFKREAIGYAWEFLTGVLGLPPEKLWVTVHVSDDEAADIWLGEVGVDPARFSRLDEDNFWQMGDTGPCGPSSEIFYDHGPEIAGGPPGSPDDDGDRYIEIWNLVFMQYERATDGTLAALPNPSIDTGMGLERIAAVMQGVHNNYDIDLFRSLIAAAAELAGCDDHSAQSLRVIADHIRSTAFLVLDGVLPGNEGRNYVLRRIMRRAIRHGHKLGINEPFFYRLVAPLAREMGDAYPELRERQDDVARVIRAEEEQFAVTLEHGMAILNDAIATMNGDTLAGDVVFRLYDTYGFPVDLTADVARERDLKVDMAGFEAAMAEQRRRSQAAGSFRFDYTGVVKLDGDTEFTGYDRSEDESVVAALFADGQSCERLDEGQQGVVVLKNSPFYAESGGQVGDTGYICGDNSRFEVDDTTKTGGNHLHHGKVLAGGMRVGDRVRATIDAGVRRATALNHSATHLLHAALRQVLGSHVTQKGSLVDSERLRFDFSHFEAMTAAQVEAVEDLVNEQIRANSAVTTELTDMESARRKGAMALFGEKYGDTVRVLTMGDGFSVELCGGTHVQRTGDIGQLRIVSEGGISAGVRRVEAVTGAQALAWSRAGEQRLSEVAALVKANRETVVDKVGQLLGANRQLEKELQSLRGRLASSAGSDLAAAARDVEGIKVVAARVETTDAASLRGTVDQLKSKLGAAVILLAGVADGEVRLVAGVTSTETGRIRAGDLLRMFAGEIGGKGGGKPDMAQGGGGDPAAVPGALESVVPWVESQLAAAR